MTNNFRIAGAIVVLALSGAVAMAQTGDADLRRVCGSQWIDDGHNAEAVVNTARLNPVTYQHMIARAKQGPGMMKLASVVGDYTFFVRQRSAPYNFQEVPATLRYNGRKARIWVDDRDNARISASTINQLAIRLDSITSSISRDPSKGILENDIEVFGETPKVFEQEGKTEFLITDIQDSLVGAFVAGYFNPYDQTSQPGSNQLNMLYIDSKEGLNSGLNAVSNTLAHEFQHLIHFATNRSSETVFNEGCSEAASIICGYPDRRMSDYFAAPNVSLFRWSYNDGSKVLADYTRAMTFMYYMYTQFGDGFMRTFNATQTEGMVRLRDAMNASGHGDDWRSAVRNWATCNYVQRLYPDPRYTYPKAIDNLANRKPATAAKYDTTLTSANGSITLEVNAASYIEYANPKTGPYGLNAMFTSNGNIGVMAILYRRFGSISDSCVEVRQLTAGQNEFIGAGGAYSKVVFVMINTEESKVTSAVDWTISQSTLGVDDDVKTGAFLSIAGVAPNPAVNAATISFTTASSRGSTSIDLYDINGLLVRRLVDAAGYEAGEHSLSVPLGDLPVGYYLVRLAQGDRVVNSSLMIAR